MDHRQGKNQQSKTTDHGILYVVATPIGNLEDITLRALRVLREVDLIASEDTRHTKKLLSRYDIHTPLLSYYKGKEIERGETIISCLEQGDDVALVSDAGTPGISDPGAILVKMAQAKGLPVVPLPGPSALASVLSVSGLTGTSYFFVGFLPSKAGQRKKFLQSMSSSRAAIVFYESPRRILKTLTDCLEILGGQRHVIIGRELTKIHEEIMHGPLAEVLDVLQKREALKGEFTVIIEGISGQEKPPAKELPELLRWYRDEARLSLRDAVKTIAGDLGLPRSEVYKEALKVWE